MTLNTESQTEESSSQMKNSTTTTSASTLISTSVTQDVKTDSDLEIIPPSALVRPEMIKHLPVFKHKNKHKHKSKKLSKNSVTGEMCDEICNSSSSEDEELAYLRSLKERIALEEWERQSARDLREKIEQVRDLSHQSQSHCLVII